MKRRVFLKTGAMAGAGLILTGRHVYGQSPNLRKYVDPLPIPPPIDMRSGGLYEISMAPGSHQFHANLLPAPVWGYAPGNVAVAGYLGPTIVAQKNVAVTIKWHNRLPQNNQHPVEAAIDNTLPDPTTYATFNRSGRAVPHLHGGFIQPQVDGHPESWWVGDPVSGSGTHYITDTFMYGNQQPAAGLWYHDHAIGITRLNVYAGLAAGYLIRDAKEAALNLPVGPYEIPLIIQDKAFNPNGSMLYPTIGIVPNVHPKWVPEFFGDTPVVNGKAYPFLNVEPRRYRFRVYNGSQARFYNMWFDDGLNPVAFYQIGAEQGFLPAPVMLTKLLIAPGERADIIFDFTGMAPGTVLTLKNNAKAPYPGGRGGQVSQIMQFRVGALQGTDNTTPAAALVLSPLDPPALSPVGKPVKNILMEEQVDPVTGLPVRMLLNGKFFADPVSPPQDHVAKGATEVWQFFNLTVDAHPMHLHLVAFQVVNRQPINAKALAAARAAGLSPDPNLYVVGAPVPPAPNETGWKDTAVSMPGEVLRVVAKFDLPTVGAPVLPVGVSGPQYVYHCHILEHEENDMMRPFEVVG